MTITRHAGELNNEEPPLYAWTRRISGAIHTGNITSLTDWIEDTREDGVIAYDHCYVMTDAGTLAEVEVTTTPGRWFTMTRVTLDGREIDCLSVAEVETDPSEILT